VRFAKPETNRIFERELDKITGKTNTMDFFEQVRQLRYEEAEEKGIKKGRMKNQREVVKRLLAKGVSVKETAAIAGVSVAFVERIKKPAKKPVAVK